MDENKDQETERGMKFDYSSKFDRNSTKASYNIRNSIRAFYDSRKINNTSQYKYGNYLRKTPHMFD